MNRWAQRFSDVNQLVFSWFNYAQSNNDFWRLSKLGPIKPNLQVDILIKALAKFPAKRIIKKPIGKRRRRLTREIFKSICQLAWDRKREYAITKMISRKTAPHCSLAIVWSSSLLQKVLVFMRPSHSYGDGKLYLVNKNCASALKAVVKR